MSFSVDEEKMKEIAKDLGLEITFGSDKPGVYNTTTGEFKELEDFFPELQALKEVICEHCDNLTATFTSISIEGISFAGHTDCMEELVEMYESGKYTVEEYIRDFKSRSNPNQ